MSLKELDELYSHIELTEDEQLEGMIWAKQRKEDRMKVQERKEREAENRRILTGTRWTFDQTDSFMRYRMTEVFHNDFQLDDDNRELYLLLCLYFSSDPMFNLKAKEIFDVEKPSLKKGLMISGNTGTGKTSFMRLFSRNQRQVFHVKTAMDLANSVGQHGESAYQEIIKCSPLPVNDSNSFFHPVAGLCVDDLGSEAEKTYYGNKKNVIGDMIESRYHNGNVGILLHATTNMDGKGIEGFYGARVKSRVHEIFNFLELTGKDRRK